MGQRGFLTDDGDNLFVSSVCLLFVVFSGFLLFYHVQADANPRYAALEGLSCRVCHVNVRGGGLRNSRGWRYSRDTGLIKPESGVLGSLYEKDGASNTLLNRRLTFGYDFRFQTVRSHKTEDSDRRYFPMQAAFESAFRINDYAMIESTYNAGPKKFQGQESWSASVIVGPRFSTNNLRIGYFQPSTGIRYDDHTMLVRYIGNAGLTTLIPVNYAEIGAEVSYAPTGAVTLTAGVFDGGNLAENRMIDRYGTDVSLLENPHSPLYLGRMDVLLPGIDGILHSSAGISHLAHTDFSLSTVFFSLGLMKRIAVFGEIAATDSRDMRDTMNYSIEADYRIHDAIIIYVRGENADTDLGYRDFNVETYAKQSVFGAQIVLAPYIELRPEYRIVDTERYRSARYAVQIHLFR